MATYVIEFRDRNGNRKTLSVGKFCHTKRQFEIVRDHIKVLNASRISNTPIEDATARWLNGIGEIFREKLVEVGLIDDRGSTLLGMFLKQYLKTRNDLVRIGELTRGTLNNEENVCDSLLAYFTEDKNLYQITEGDAEDYYKHLLIQGTKSVKKCGTEIIIRQKVPLMESTCAESIAPLLLGSLAMPYGRN